MYGIKYLGWWILKLSESVNLAEIDSMHTPKI